MSNYIEQIKAALRGFSELPKLGELASISQQLSDIRKRLDGPLLVKGELQEPAAIRAEKGASDRRNRTIQLWLTVGTWLAFLAAAIYAGLALRQWKTMEKTYGEMQKQTGLIKQQLEQTQGAIAMATVDVIVAQNGAVEVILNNVGQAKASNLHAEVHITRRALSDGHIIGPTIEKTIDDPTLPPFRRMGDVLSSFPHRFAIPLSLSVEDLRELGQLRMTIQSEVQLKYFDGFDDQRGTVCYSYLAPFVKGMNPPNVLYRSIPCENLTTEIVKVRKQIRESGAHL